MMCFSDSVGYTQRHGWLKSRGVASLHGVETQTPINQGQVLHDLSCTIDALHDDVRPTDYGLGCLPLLHLLEQVKIVLFVRIGRGASADLLCLSCC